MGPLFNNLGIRISAGVLATTLFDFAIVERSNSSSQSCGFLIAVTTSRLHCQQFARLR